MSEYGGDPACWAHLFDERRDIATRRDVATLVQRFYRSAAMDDLLGPVFTAAHVDWPTHLARVVAKARAAKMASALQRLLAGQSAPGAEPTEVFRRGS
jgi:hypothetical protein